MKWKSGMMVLTVLLAVSLSVGCPSGGGNPDPDPPDPQPPLNVEDTSHFRMSVKGELLAEKLPVSSMPFPDTLISGNGCGTMPEGLRYWFVPEGNGAPVAFKHGELRYSTIYGGEYTYKFEVEKTEGGQYQVNGNGELLASVVPRLTGVIVAGVFLEYVECGYWGFWWGLWPLGCLPGPGKDAIPEEFGGLIDYSTIYQTSAKSTKLLSQPPWGWLEIIPSENLSYVDVEVEYSIYDDEYDRHVDKKWSGRFSFDNDGDGLANDEERSQGTDPCDSDDPNGEPTTTIVPDVIGQTLNQANNTLADAELLVGDISHAFSNTRPAGQVSGQSPAPGQVVPVGSEVDVTVSLGPEPPDTTIVPSVIGNTLSQAISALAVADLLLGQVSYDYTNTQPAEKIFFQNPVSGTEVPLDTEVDITISLGPEPPDPLSASFISPTDGALFQSGDTGLFKMNIVGGVPPFTIQFLFETGPIPGWQEGGTMSRTPQWSVNLNSTAEPGPTNAHAYGRVTDLTGAQTPVFSVSYTVH